MALTDRLAAPPPAPAKGPGCSVGQLLDTLPTDEAKALAQAIRNPQWRATQIAAELRAEGHRIGGDTVARHRRGGCKCEDGA